VWGWLGRRNLQLCCGGGSLSGGGVKQKLKRKISSSELTVTGRRTEKSKRAHRE
jgi:hypothetical protein